MSELPPRAPYNLGLEDWNHQPASSSFLPTPQLPSNYSFMDDLHGLDTGNFFRDITPHGPASLPQAGGYTTVHNNILSIDWSSITPQDFDQWDPAFAIRTGIPPLTSHSQGNLATTNIVTSRNNNPHVSANNSEIILEHPGMSSPLINASGGEERHISIDASSLSPHAITPPIPLQLDTQLMSPSVATNTNLLGIFSGGSGGILGGEGVEFFNEATATSHRERNPDKPVAPLRTRPKAMESQRSARKLTAQLNKEKSERVAADIVEAATARAKEASLLAERHSVSIHHINTLMGAPQVLKKMWKPNIGNALVRRKADELNASKSLFNIPTNDMHLTNEIT